MNGKDKESASVTSENNFSGPLRDLGGLATCGAEHCHSQADDRFLLQVRNPITKPLRYLTRLSNSVKNISGLNTVER